MVYITNSSGAIIGTANDSLLNDSPLVYGNHNLDTITRCMKEQDVEIKSSQKYLELNSVHDIKTKDLPSDLKQVAMIGMSVDPKCLKNGQFDLGLFPTRQASILFYMIQIIRFGIGDSGEMPDTAEFFDLPRIDSHFDEYKLTQIGTVPLVGQLCTDPECITTRDKIIQKFVDTEFGLRNTLEINIHNDVHGSKFNINQDADRIGIGAYYISYFCPLKMLLMRDFMDSGEAQGQIQSDIGLLYAVDRLTLESELDSVLDLITKGAEVKHYSSRFNHFFSVLFFGLIILFTISMKFV